MPRVTVIIPYFLAEIMQKMTKSVQGDLCELWIHTKCNNFNYLNYCYPQIFDESLYCIECCSTIFSFNSLSSGKNFLAFCTSTDHLVERSRK